VRVVTGVTAVIAVMAIGGSRDGASVRSVGSFRDAGTSMAVRGVVAVPGGMGGGSGVTRGRSGVTVIASVIGSPSGACPFRRT
jgi:hypothetical protein